jgi:hypothetical protein
MEMPCPHCAAVLDIAPEMANTSAACPKCEGWFAVGSIAVEPPPLPMPQTYRAPKPAPKERPQVQQWILWAMIIWSAACLLRVAYIAITQFAEPLADPKAASIALNWLTSYLMYMLIFYSVPMAVLLLGYIATKR